jgi:hypothetical protein
MEKKILESFKKKLGKEVEGLDLSISLDPDLWNEAHEVDIYEKRSNGKVWTCFCTRTGRIESILEVD